MLALVGSGGAAQPGDTAPLPLFAPLDTSQPIGFFVGTVAADSGAMSGDAELCAWALADWVAAADGRIAVEPAAEPRARIRAYFVGPGAGQYGEMRPIDVGGRRGAAVYVRPDTDALGPDIAAAVRADPLLRETIVYLTCLHELGHALGLEHTDQFADIMYFFGFGGDVVDYFRRYREQLRTRADIRLVSGLSANDARRLLEAYPGP